MKRIIALSLLASAALMSCNSTPKKTTTDKPAEQVVAKTSCCSAKKSSSCCDKKDTNVKAYYFHNTRRCVTCQTVESVASEALLTKNIKLQSINLEEKEGKELAKQLGVSGQTLLIVNGDKKENLTNFGFLNARSNPDLFKKKVLATVETLTK